MPRVHVHDAQGDFTGTNRNTEVTTEGAVRLLPLGNLVFNRDSSAYVLGSSNNQDVPRFESGAYNQSIVIEEATSNLLESIDFETGWTDIDGGGTTGTRTFTTDSTYGNIMTISRSTPSGTQYYGKRENVLGLSGYDVTVSAYVRALNALGSIYLEIGANTTPNNQGVITQTYTQSWALSGLPLNTWKRISVTWNTGRFAFVGNGDTLTIAVADGAGSIDVALPQVELKTFPTRFQNPSSSRDEETLYTTL